MLTVAERLCELRLEGRQIAILADVDPVVRRRPAGNAGHLAVRRRVPRRWTHGHRQQADAGRSSLPRRLQRRRRVDRFPVRDDHADLVDPRTTVRRQLVADGLEGIRRVRQTSTATSHIIFLILITNWIVFAKHTVGTIVTSWILLSTHQIILILITIVVVVIKHRILS